ncbi:unnamed protein product [Timema podura]|uniref:Uncharacterized protein n=1 Tax=Timema podura TaxID=61482 RepID=A0ABN7NSF3_TIMPD|nr:unnamed protein product [Timema podura]
MEKTSATIQRTTSIIYTPFTGEKETSLYVLDCVFSVTVIGSLVVFVWRGAWTILDIYLIPSSPDLSAWGSLGQIHSQIWCASSADRYQTQDDTYRDLLYRRFLTRDKRDAPPGCFFLYKRNQGRSQEGLGVLGYGIVFFTFALQTPMKLVCNRLKGIPRLLVADIYLFLSFCGTVNVWRGIWNLLNIYFIPENLELSYWVTYLVSLMILILLNCSNSILVRGVYIDGEEEGGKCVVFPCYYLRLYFQNEVGFREPLPVILTDIKSSSAFESYAWHPNLTRWRELRRPPLRSFPGRETSTDPPSQCVSCDILTRNKIVRRSLLLHQKGHLCALLTSVPTCDVFLVSKYWYENV